MNYSLQPYEGLDPVDFCYSYENRYKELKTIAPSTAQINHLVPKNHKDWNEALMAQRRWEREQQQSQKRSRGRGLSR